VKIVVDVLAIDAFTLVSAALVVLETLAVFLEAAALYAVAVRLVFGFLHLLRCFSCDKVPAVVAVALRPAELAVPVAFAVID
jgi:hypothetical protein